MKNRINRLSIGKSIFMMTVLVVGLSMLVSSIVAYQIIYTRTDNLIESTSKEINKQVVLNYENYLSNVIDTSNALQKYIVDFTKETRIDDLSDVFTTTSTLDKNIVAVALFDLLGNPIAYSGDGVILGDAITKSWFFTAVSIPEIHHFSSPHSEDIFLDIEKDVFTISKYVRYYQAGLEVSGILAIDIDTLDFKTLASMTNLGDQGHIVITDEDDNLIYSSLNSCADDSCESVLVMTDLIIGGERIQIDGLNMYVNVNTIKYTRWNIATFINVDEITNTKWEMLLTLVGVFGLTMIVIALTSAALSTRITNPLNLLEDHIKKIEQGDFDTRLSLTGQHEVVLLAETFNTMSDRIKELMNRVMKEQREKRKTQFLALQNQINPHFLYNTLDSIVWLSENKRNEDVERAIIALSKFFRMSISSVEGPVLLKDEIDHVTAYLQIQQIRYHNTFRFEFDVPKETMTIPVIKFMLQPLVENAIHHGLKPEESYSRIQIRARIMGEELHIQVENEGYGIHPKRIEEITKIFKGEIASKSIGLRNIYQRLTLQFGKEADMKLESILDESTMVTVMIPMTQVK